TLDELIRFVPGPDLPGGGKIIGLDGIRDAYASGRGSFRTRARARVESISARKRAIVVTELPYQVGPERVIDKIKDAVNAKKVQGISAVADFSDREHGLRLVIEVKNAFNPDAVLEALYRYTPLEESFGINNVALVDGQPRTLGLRELLQVYVGHRLDVVTRRTRHRLGARTDRLHLVNGLLIAIADIDEVIQVIRTSDNAEQARTRLMAVFDLTETQAEYILELRLRRLTRFSRIELEAERDSLAAEIASLSAILESDALLREVVGDELADVAARFGTPRRTVLLEASGATATAARAPGSVPLEVPDVPCTVMLSGTDLIARVDGTISRDGQRRAHDALRSAVVTTTHGHIGLVTSRGRVVRESVLDIPSLAPVEGAPGLSGGSVVTEMIRLEPSEDVVGLVPLGDGAPTVVLATAGGVVKRLSPAEFPTKDSFDVITLKEGDRVVGVATTASEEDRIVLVATNSQLLHFPASAVRPQGRGAGGMTGMRLDGGAQVLSLGVVPEDSASRTVVVTVAGTASALPGTVAGSAKVTPFDRYPGKGRATGGVRSHRFLRGEDCLQLAWVGVAPRAVGAAGQGIELPEQDERRDASGQPLAGPLAAIG
ncbi:MAG: DNA topoisomerase IV, partial [Actinomycetes bacterium]|nr:DNA topoisomerase IV [Actinomycetes bacterium]MDX5380102.1 DNA topoisomerase IV [Actinomycetes bacterium]MDX5398696.1 DNA topoisomerase IV [Actinomycetes bacterium]MDX5449811.1 DNA topoisomerase IV [Actinomycetes bacterium]